MLTKGYFSLNDTGIVIWFVLFVYLVYPFSTKENKETKQTKELLLLSLSVPTAYFLLLTPHFFSFALCAMLPALYVSRPTSSIELFGIFHIS